MISIISREQLRHGNSYLFQGGEHGGVPISFFWVQAAPGSGPRLHKHPYEEIFVIQEGHATFIVGDSTIEVDGGHVVIAPAGVPHKFINTGHPTKRLSQSGLRTETVSQSLRRFSQEVFF